MLRDLKNNVGEQESIAPQTVTNGTINGSSLDLNRFGSAMILIMAGAIADGTHLFKMEESDDDSSWSTVAAADLEGSFEANLTTLVNRRVGYKGNKRYIRPSVLTSGVSGSVIFGASFLMGHADASPIAD